MKRIAILVIAAGLVFPAAETMAQPMGGPMMGRGMMGGNFSPRRPYVRQNGVPEAYRNLTNPQQASEENIQAGKQLFEARCAVCHGSSGTGDGPAAAQLNPAPTDLNYATRTPIANDGYLYWSIAEGGVPVGSAMPPFKSSMNKEEIWKVILYLRKL
jgi:mono/diheme cytochrome c family protein